MINYFKGTLAILAMALLLVNCRKKEWEEYYSRPEGKAPPIYQVLESKGNFKQLLACIDKAGYREILGTAGYWTFFAPTDSAFGTYFQEKGLRGIDQLDSLTARQIVRYCLVYNSFNQERLDDFQGSKGWEANNAFKRRTTYYELFDTATVGGQLLDIVAANRPTSYVAGDNSNKYIPFFLAPYFAQKGLSATDYTYFYPHSAYSGFNIMDARVVAANIAAENGTIHAVDRVLAPPANLEKHLASRPEYSLFKSLFDRFLVTYTENAAATDRYQVLFGGNKQVFVKSYNSGLAFGLNNENFLKAQDNDGQMSGWTLFAPQNDVLEQYLKEVVLEHFGGTLDGLSQLPQQIILDFLNAHMWQSPVWPSKFASTANFLGEEARFHTATDILEKKILSNGFFYGTNKVQESNYFSTVYSRPYLDPEYSMMTRLLNSNLRPLLSNPNSQLDYAVLLLSDEALGRLGYSWNANRSTWEKAGTTAKPDADLLRLANLHIIPYPKNQPIDFSGSGIVETVGGEMLRYNDNQIFGAGNTDSSLNFTIAPAKTKKLKNGTAYYPADAISLKFSVKGVGQRLEELAGTSATASPYYNFFQYLKNSSLWTAASKSIAGVPLGFTGTFLIPTNEAIDSAVKYSYLPGKTVSGKLVADFAPTDQVAKEKVAKFLRYHIIKKAVIANGKVQGGTESLLKNALTDVTSNVRVDGNNLVFTDEQGRIARLNPARPAFSNLLGDRVVFHSIDTYLSY